jgi:hypothetical protein
MRLMFIWVEFNGRLSVTASLFDNPLEKNWNLTGGGEARLPPFLNTCVSGEKKQAMKPDTV